MEKKERFSLGFVGFLQALGLVVYCGLVAAFFWQGNRWFGRAPNFYGPLLTLVLFTTSALICAVIALSYPFILWQQKKPSQAVRLIIYTAAWLLFFSLLLILIISF